MNKIRFAMLQTAVAEEKTANIENAARLMDSPELRGADFVTLPEMFSCPYVTSNFPKYAEPEGGACWRACSELARTHGVYLSAGSMPEIDEDGRVYNTAYVFDRSGVQIAKHRKVHLFDIDVEGGQSFRESDTLTAGSSFEVFDTEFGKMGLCICFDYRFPEGARLMALDGARVMLVPAAFNMTTGPLHWELMHRGRSVENQFFTVATAPARDEKGPYVSYGHSMAVDPWGKVTADLGAAACVRLVELDLDMVDEVRSQLPLMSARRTDIYELKRK